MAMTVHEAWVWLTGKRMAILLLLAVAAFCLVGGAPMAVADMGCDGHSESGKICAQSGAVAPVLGVTPQAPPIARAASSTAWLVLGPPSERVPQVQSASSSPRAPPFLLH
jgi:hypothetical protein